MSSKPNLLFTLFLTSYEGPDAAAALVCSPRSPRRVVAVGLSNFQCFHFARHDFSAASLVSGNLVFRSLLLVCYPLGACRPCLQQVWCLVGVVEVKPKQNNIRISSSARNHKCFKNLQVSEFEGHREGRRDDEEGRAEMVRQRLSGKYRLGWGDTIHPLWAAKTAAFVSSHLLAR